MLEVNNEDDKDIPITLTTKEEMVYAIIQRNQPRTRQSLYTPFAANKTLAEAVNIHNESNRMPKLLDGTFLNSVTPLPMLTNTAKEWIQAHKNK